MRQQWKQWQERWRDPALTGLLIIQTILLFVLRPILVMVDTAAGRWEALGMALTIVSLLGTFAVMLLALLVVSRNRAAEAVVVASIACMLGALFLSLWDYTPATRAVALASTFLFVAAMSWVIAQAVFGGGRVTYHRITGAVVLYFAIAEIFAALYELLMVFAPHALSGIAAGSGSGFLRSEVVLREQLLYFSFSSLTTASFGDILPIHPLAKSLANLEAVVGQMFPTILLGRIVTLEIESRRNKA